MYVSIEVHFKGNVSNIMRRGSFPIRENTDDEIIRVARKWIDQLRGEYQSFTLEKVIINGKDDIALLL